MYDFHSASRPFNSQLHKEDHFVPNFSTLKKSEVRFKTSSSFRLDCSKAAYKIRIEHSMVIIIGINTVRIVKEIYNADRPITSSTKNLEQGRTKDKNQTVAMRT